MTTEETKRETLRGGKMVRGMKGDEREEGFDQ